jgi:hypothetical protein
MARKIDRSVSRATVYRTLPLLVECGVLKEMDFGKDYKFYDPNYAEHPHHNHIICQDCEKIVEFESEKLEKLESEISEKLGFRQIPAVASRPAQIRRGREPEGRGLMAEFTVRLPRYLTSDSSLLIPPCGKAAFQKPALLQQYSESVSFDWRLWRQDIAGSIAHSRSKRPG